MAWRGLDPAEGFALITSRCSVEVVQKAAAVGIPVLVAISAPTALARRMAEGCGLTWWPWRAPTASWSSRTPGASWVLDEDRSPGRHGQPDRRLLRRLSA
jgi:hypothetical protein